MGEITEAQSEIYNYLIALGAVGLVAVYVPLHTVLHTPRSRTGYRATAIFFALLASTACFVGAALGGTLWQTLPTGVFLLFLVAIVALRVAGGWGAVRQRARAPGRFLVGVVDEGYWRDDVSKEEWMRLAEKSGAAKSLLLMGSETDQDAVAVGLMAESRWKSGGGEGVGDEVPSVDRHEAPGLAMLGLVRYRGMWMTPLLQKIREEGPLRAKLAALHHAGVFLWFLGNLMGGFAKTGWWAGHFVIEDGKRVYNGSQELRVGGIWVQSILLLIAVYALPYTRGVVRVGMTASGRLSLMWAQAILSLIIGVCSVLWAREGKVVGTNVAYGFSLAISAAAAAVWSVISVSAYGMGVKRLMHGDDDNIVEDGEAGFAARRRAYIACLLTRPRSGYIGKAPVARWGDGGKKGSRLEVVLQSDEVVSSEGELAGAAELEDVPLSAEWEVLENAAKRKKRAFL